MPDQSRPSGLLIEVPIELQAAVHEIASLRHDRHQTTLHILNHYGPQYQRALAYYLFGTYRHIMLNKLVLIMEPGPPDASLALAESIAAEHGCRVELSCHLGGRDIHYLQFDIDQRRSELAAAADAILLAHQGKVVYCGAENYLSYADSPGDPNVRYELGSCYTPLSVSAPLAWQKTRGATASGEPVLVALFDSGFYRDMNDDTYEPQGEHEDLRGVYYNLGDYGYRVNYSGNASENIYYPWEDLVDPSPIMYPYQTLGHGTRVAGVIAAQVNNLGVAGVAPDAKIVPFRLYVQSLSYIPVSNLTAAAEVCVEAKAAGHDIRVVNISAHVEGGEETADLELAVRAMSDAGILTVSSTTGNDGNNRSGDPYWLFPAAFKAFADGGPIPNIIAVAWLGIDNRFKDFNADGPLSEDDWDWSLTDVFAPSEQMMLTNADGGYISDPPQQASGVSFGIPAVVGIAALYCAAHPTWTAAEVRQAVIDAARPIYNFGVDSHGMFRYRRAYAGYVAYPADSAGIAAPGFACDRQQGLISAGLGWEQVPDTQLRETRRDLTDYHDMAVLNGTLVEGLDQISSEAAALVSLPIYTGGATSQYLYFTRARLASGWVPWGAPGSIYSAPVHHQVGDFAECGGSGYILFQPTANRQDNYLVPYGIGSALSGLAADEAPLELTTGNGGLDTLLLSYDQGANEYWFRWQIWGMQHWAQPVVTLPANRVCALGNLSGKAGCAWVNPATRECNVGSVDAFSGLPWGVSWDAPSPIDLDAVLPGWPQERTIVGTALAGSPQGLHYLVIVSENRVPGYETFVVEGVRLMQHPPLDDTPIIEGLLVLPRDKPETRLEVDPKIDHLNRLQLCYALYEGGVMQSNGYYAQTLDYGNIP